jgi:Domain of unknown function (DUF4404)
MDPNLLSDHLKQFHEELSTARRANPESHPVLGELQDDIARLMERSSARATPPEALSAAGVPTDEDESTLPDRLERIAVQFEVDHPTLAASSRRLVDLLGKAGL